MWPWGHLAVGYLLYVLGVRLLGREHDRLALVALAVGTQFPDLVDKPLAWVGLLPYGRSLAHSLFFLVPGLVGVVLVAERLDERRTGAAFSVGALTHVVTDGWDELIAFDFGELSFLLWPVRPLPEQTAPATPSHHVDRLVDSIEATRASPDGLLGATLSEPIGQFALFALVGGLWVVGGMPGWRR